MIFPGPVIWSLDQFPKGLGKGRGTLLDCTVLPDFLALTFEFVGGWEGADVFIVGSLADLDVWVFLGVWLIIAFGGLVYAENFTVGVPEIGFWVQV